jgi:hypothetical protein
MGPVRSESLDDVGLKSTTNTAFGRSNPKFWSDENCELRRTIRASVYWTVYWFGFAHNSGTSKMTNKYSMLNNLA